MLVLDSLHGLFSSLRMGFRLELVIAHNFHGLHAYHGADKYLLARVCVLGMAEWMDG